MESCCIAQGLSSLLCDDLDGWDGGEWGGEVKERGAICIVTANSQSVRTETNTTLQSNYTPIKKEKKKVKWNAVLLPCFSRSLVILAVFPARAFPQGLFSAPTLVPCLRPSFPQRRWFLSWPGEDQS